jgi:hypothetical protein
MLLADKTNAAFIAFVRSPIRVVMWLTVVESPDLGDRSFRWCCVAVKGSGWASSSDGKLSVSKTREMECICVFR